MKERKKKDMTKRDVEVYGDIVNFDDRVSWVQDLIFISKNLFVCFYFHPQFGKVLYKVAAEFVKFLKKNLHCHKIYFGNWNFLQKIFLKSQINK